MKVGARDSWPFAVALLLLWASCGGSAEYPVGDPVEPERENPVELESEQITTFEQLETALARREPDCSVACDLADTICGLSSRICGIADRHREDAETAGRCRDATERCDRGRERVAESCACGGS